MCVIAWTVSEIEPTESELLHRCKWIYNRWDHPEPTAWLPFVSRQSRMRHPRYLNTSQTETMSFIATNALRYQILWSGNRPQKDRLNMFNAHKRSTNSHMYVYWYKLVPFFASNIRSTFDNNVPLLLIWYVNGRNSFTA